MRFLLLVAVLVLVVAAGPVAAQSPDRAPSRCSFRSATTCWTIWGPRATPQSSERLDQPEKDQPRDTLPAFARSRLNGGSIRNGDHHSAHRINLVFID